MHRHAPRLLAGSIVLMAVFFLTRADQNEVPDAAPDAVADSDAAPRARIRRSVRPPVRGTAATAPAPDEAGDSGAPLAELPADTGDTGGPPLPAQVTVMLVDTDGEPVEDGIIYSPDCGIWQGLYKPGETSFMVPEGACLFQGRRRDGLLWGRSEWLEVDLMAGDFVELELVVPLERTGGLGVQIEAHDEGIQVVRVWPGTPAYEMGLEPGDVITGVDGLPASALTMDEFIEVMTGPVGTDVEFELSYFGDTGLRFDTMTLTRAWLNN